MPQTRSRIRWHQPSLPAEETLTMHRAGAPALITEREAVRQMILQVGIPVVEGAETAKEYAIGLLKLAAEVEHALMVQYLYAAFSLPNEAASDSVNYHLRLMNIAIQEMGHLTTLQNLLLLLGGRDAFYMQRDLIREESEKNPIPFVLEPVSMASLAKYVAAEKPAQVPPELAAKVAELVKLAEHDSGVDTHRVGVIFELLKWIFTPPGASPESIDFSSHAPLPAEPHITDEDLQENLIVVPKFEAHREEWEVNVEDIILEPVHTVSEARNILDEIARQGEGLTNGGPSHFTEFMAIVAAFEAGLISVKSMPKAPTLINDETGELISHPYARLWVEVFNAQYNLLVLAIYHALVTARPDDGSPGLRDSLTTISLHSMRRVIQPLANLISSLPLDAAGGPAKAGPSFALDHSILNSNVEADLVAQHIRMLDNLATLYTAIESAPDFASFPGHGNTLTNLRNTDRRRRNLFPAPTPTPISDLQPTGEVKTMRYRIFPSVGIARLGEDEDFFLGPERPGDPPGELQADGTVIPVTRFKDATRTKIRKQGARFHIFESEDGINWSLANLPETASVTWTVTLENTKSAVTRPANPPTAPMRPEVPAANQRLAIKGGTKEITGPNATSTRFIGPYATTAPDGSAFEVEVDLGQLRTDGQGRLIVLGGKGQSRAPAGVPLGGSFYRNPKWHDDVADGPVTASIQLSPADEPVQAEQGAWVIVAPPDYAPGIDCVVTLYDVLRQLGISDLGLAAPGTPSFDLDINPIITRVRRLRFVHADATWSDARFTNPNLRSRDAAHQQLRSDVRDLVLSTESVFAGHISPAGPPFRLRSFQRKFLNDWAVGNFDDTPANSDGNLTAEGLTRASLDGAAGQGFCPGIEAGIIVLDKTLYSTPFDFRFSHASIKAGDITSLMAQPWQADFLKCHTEWWPTQRPDLAPQASGDFEDWVRGAAGHKLLVERHPRLGLVVQQGAEEVFVEVERDPNL